jgi:hypothetical protein
LKLKRERKEKHTHKLTRRVKVGEGCVYTRLVQEQMRA